MLVLMKPHLIFLFLFFAGALSAAELDSRLVFPPFAKEDVANSDRSLSAETTHEELISIPLEELRGIMSSRNLAEQYQAASELLQRGDQKTILRIVYSLKQGNVGAGEILRINNKLAMIPFLMEDVAHGSLEFYGAYLAEDVVIGDNSVREAATRRVAEILANAPEFTGETRAYLRAISSGTESWVQGLSSQSRYLVEWWLLNEVAFGSARWEDTRPLPQEITFTNLKDDHVIPRGELRLRAQRPPMYAPEWNLTESFESWSERIVDPTRRNLDFVDLSWDGNNVVEQPSRSLDPKALRPQDRKLLKISAPRNPPLSESANEKKNMFRIIVFVVLMSVISLVWWKRIKAG
jgi:hypothetical protein